MRLWRHGGLAGALVIAIAACTGDARLTVSPAAPILAQHAMATADPSEPPSRTLPPASPATPAPSVADGAPDEPDTEAFDPADFGAGSADVDNVWFPLTPGTQWTWEGGATIDGHRLARRVVFTVTDLVKVVDGVTVVVAYDQDITDGVLEEVELAFFAQAADGTVWHFGQYPEVYEDGKLAETPAWIAGRQGAQPGITMKRNPDPYARSYSQGWGPAVGWADRAKVFEVGSRTCVPVGCYDDVLVMDEFERGEADAHQLKYYARDVGGVRVGWAGAREEEQEVLELVEFERLDPAAMAKIRAAVLAQDERAYETVGDVYGATSHATLRHGDG